MADISLAMKLVLANEGGFADHPNDRGGATNYGITHATLAKWRGVSSVTAEQVRALTLEEAARIYKAEYWDKMNLDRVKNQTVAEMIFDQGVNFGWKTSAKRVQKVLNGFVKEPLVVDGIIGSVTLEALNKMKKEPFCREFFKESQLAYLAIVQNEMKNKPGQPPTQLVFLEGWLRRTHKYLGLSLR